MKWDAKRLTLTAVFLAMVTMMTSFTAIPVPPLGNINLGDAVIFVAAFFLNPIDAGIAAGIGAALSDISGGYAQYAIFTLVIKFIMGYGASRIYKSKFEKEAGRILAGMLFGVLVLVGGYYIAQVILTLKDTGFTNSFVAAIATLPLNLAQGVGSLILSYLTVFAIRKNSQLRRIYIRE